MEAAKIIIAAGATENALSFPGWTLPGVMTAGCAQTLINVHRVLPGRRVLMVGSGNVGVIVAYQLLQAGAEVAAVIEAAPQLGGYGVHTAKVRRAGVPFYISTTVAKAEGVECVENAVIVKVDSKFKPIEGTERMLDVSALQ
jgi:NADPH-dependent 2,4-dienoyl-CoA reductase/sulfur reductase-like enzyme